MTHVDAVGRQGRSVSGSEVKQYLAEASFPLSTKFEEANTPLVIVYNQNSSRVHVYIPLRLLLPVFKFVCKDICFCNSPARECPQLDVFELRIYMEGDGTNWGIKIYQPSNICMQQ